MGERDKNTKEEGCVDSEEAKSRPLFSIVMPVYNSREYLDYSIHSVLDQTYENFELLIVDDGSDDGSSELVDQLALKDPRIRVFHTMHFGLSHARNVALDKALGTYVMFCDNDDYMYPNTLDVCLAINARTKSRFDQVHL